MTRNSSRIAGYGHPLYEESNAASPKEIEEEPTKTQDNSEFRTSNSELTCVAILPLLRHGSTGAAVECAQFCLIRLGYSCGGPIRNGHEVPDGDFGPLTEAAVRSFQQRAGLDTDGVLGSETWTQLLIYE